MTYVFFTYDIEEATPSQYSAVNQALSLSKYEVRLTNTTWDGTVSSAEELKRHVNEAMTKAGVKSYKLAFSINGCFGGEVQNVPESVSNPASRIPMPWDAPS
ncbi:hypothetical protein [Luteolibacter sp. LG18]|uniref:hypothetical protein n=1 Tax=Luteolibacter sp. LG18 TaxID=2819286 RepID=UPI0030C6B31D